MVRWIHRIELADFYHSDEIDIFVKAAKVYNRIRCSMPPALFDANSDAYDSEIDEISDNFLCLSAQRDRINADDAVEEFDDYMAMLYDYGDQHIESNDSRELVRLAWINTIK